MSVDDLLQTRRREHEALLKKIQSVLQADQRIVAAWLFGSEGRHTSDVLSDLDVWLVVKYESIETIGAGRQHYAAQLERPVLLLESPQNAPAGGAYLMALYPGRAAYIKWIGTGSDKRMRACLSRQRCCLTGEASHRICARSSWTQPEPLLFSHSKSVQSRPPNSAPTFGP